MDKKEFLAKCGRMYNLMQSINTVPTYERFTEGFKNFVGEISQHSQSTTVADEKRLLINRELSTNVPKYEKLVPFIINENRTLQRQIAKLRMAGHGAGNIVTYMEYNRKLSKFIIGVTRDTNASVSEEYDFTHVVGTYITNIVDKSRDLNIDRICLYPSLLTNSDFLLYIPCTYETLEYNLANIGITTLSNGYTLEGAILDIMDNYCKVMIYDYSYGLSIGERRKMNFDISKAANSLIDIYSYNRVNNNLSRQGLIAEIAVRFARLKAIQQILKSDTKYKELSDLKYCDMQYFDWLRQVTSLKDLQYVIEHKLRTIGDDTTYTYFTIDLLRVLRDHKILSVVDPNKIVKITKDTVARKLPASENIRLNVRMLEAVDLIQ